MQEIKDPSSAYSVYPGPILLLAGPGTGKTYQLKNRIKYLIETLNVSPEEIRVITFTNEAARNMREKLFEEENGIQFLSTEKHPLISTMHSLGHQIVEDNPNDVSLDDDFDLITDESFRNVLFEDAMRLSKLGGDVWKATKRCRAESLCNEDRTNNKCIICNNYKFILSKCGLIDYDDQILLACKILSSNNAYLEKLNKTTKYLLVDEYQDINYSQCELIKLLTKGQDEGFFAVGDDDQSIYSFRGGSPKYIIDFEKDYGTKAKIGRLYESYRCPEHILKGAKAIINKYYPNSAPKPEPIFNKKIKSNNKIIFYDVPSYSFEARKIASLVKEKRRLGSFIIIVPNSNYIPALKEAFSHNNIEYRCKTKINDNGLKRFIALADWIENKDSNHTLRYLIDLMINNNNELLKSINSNIKGIKQKREIASEIIADLWKEVDDDRSLYDVISENHGKRKVEKIIVNIANSLDEIHNLVTEKGTSQKSNADFLHKCGLLICPGKNPVNLLSEIKEWINELAGGKKTDGSKPVEIYTIQSSKGLEADFVCVIGVSNGLLPNPEEDIAEQSRLFFVAMTRARQELYLFNSRTRPISITYAERGFQLQKSIFIDSIPTKHIQIEPIYLAQKKKKS